MVIFLTDSIVLKLSGIAGVCFGLVLMIYSMISSYGPTEVILPFPIPDTIAMSFIYYLLFFTLYIGVLPVAETAYFTIFLDEEMKEHFSVLKDVVISASYAGMNLMLLFFVMNKFMAILIYCGFAFLVMFGMLYVKKTRGMSYALAFRMTIAVGISFWVLYLGMTRQNWLRRKSPVYYFSGNFKNFWKRF